MSETRAMVGIIGAHNGPGKLLQDVVILVGGLGRGNSGKLFSFVSGKSVGHQIQSLIPAHLDKLTIAFDQR